MALAKEGVFVTPSTDVRTLIELDSTELEAGLYYCNSSKTITAGGIEVTSDTWTVMCISTINKSSMHCYMQLWVPVGTNISASDATVFVRYSATGSTTYSAFQALTNNSHAVQNASGGDVRIVVSNTQPAAITGVTQIWIDTSV